MANQNKLKRTYPTTVKTVTRTVETQSTKPNVEMKRMKVNPSQPYIAAVIYNIT